MKSLLMIGVMLTVLAGAPALAVRAHPLEGPRTPETEALEKKTIAFR